MLDQDDLPEVGAGTRRCMERKPECLFVFSLPMTTRSFAMDWHLFYAPSRILEVVGSATNGRDAVAQIQKLRPEVVVMDISMPGAQWHRRRGPTAYTAPGDPGDYPIDALEPRTCRPRADRWRVGLSAERIGGNRSGASRARGSTGRAVILCSRVRDMMIDIVTSPSPSDNPLAVLSPREREVMQLVVEGKSSRVIAQTLALSEKTVETYRSRIMQKLQVNGLAGLIHFAIQHGLVDQ